jgi:hypothetical protein
MMNWEQPRMKAKLLTDKTPGPAALEAEPQELLTDVWELILGARQTVARGVNAALVLLHWQIGQRIRRGILAPVYELAWPFLRKLLSFRRLLAHMAMP